MKSFKICGLISILSLTILAGCTSTKIKVEREATSDEIQQIQDDLSETRKEITSISTEVVSESDDSAGFKGDADKFATKSKTTYQNKATFFDNDTSIVYERNAKEEQSSPLISYNSSSSSKRTTSFALDSSNQITMTSATDTKKEQDKYATREYYGSFLGSSENNISVQSAYESQKAEEINTFLKLNTSGMKIFKSGNEFVYVSEQKQSTGSQFGIMLQKNYSVIKVAKINDKYAMTSYENSQEIYLTSRNYEDIAPALLSRNSEKGTLSYSEAGTLNDAKPSYSDYLKYVALKPSISVFYNVSNNSSYPQYNGWNRLDMNLNGFQKDTSYSAAYGTEKNKFDYQVTYKTLLDIFDSISSRNYNIVNYVTDLAFAFNAGDTTPLTNISKDSNVTGEINTITAINDNNSYKTFSFPMTYLTAQNNYNTSNGSNDNILFTNEVTYQSLDVSSGEVTIDSNLD